MNYFRVGLLGVLIVVLINVWFEDLLTILERIIYFIFGVYMCYLTEKEIADFDHNED